MTRSVITWGATYWPWFLSLTALAFLVPETYAFFTNTANTLSDFAWNELGLHGSVTPHNISWWLSFVAWSVFVVVITGHIWFLTPS